MSKPEKIKEENRETQAVAPWRSFPELQRMEWEMERLFDSFFGPRWSPLGTRRSWPGIGQDTAGLSVDVDLYEDKDEIIAKAELPGMDKGDIEVNIADSTLTIKGEKKKEEETKDEHYYYSDRSYGSLVRRINLPREVQTDKARASFKNGVLEIRLPKTEEAKHKETKVRVE